MPPRQPMDLSPKAFLKARRPEQFSDTVVAPVTELDRSLLEYHIASVTTRSQEADFARFAHRLCEKEVCPNLLPQTGPTGGGDSKVDAETYPVADGLSAGWYEGIGRSASEERWAFAFSAKEDWAPKCRADIDKLVATNRGYAKAFFVTNQAVPDRKRAAEEDALRTRLRVDVRILDRTWILDRVFTGRHERLAVDELKVTALSRSNSIKGPLDAKREQQLSQVEGRLLAALSVGDLSGALVDDALDAAILARGLERPQAELIGRFNRAKDLANQYGTLRQRVEAAYQLAWTAYWWLEDTAMLTQQYTEVENLARDSLNPYDLERLTTLWQLLHTAVSQGTLRSEDAVLKARTKTLISSLKRLRDVDDRPSSALQAEALLCNVGLLRHLASNEAVDGYLRSLTTIVQKSKGLVGFPLEPLVDMITEMGALLDNSPAYADLFETVVSTVSRNDGEIRAARLLLGHGETKLHQQRPADCIATLGRALVKLYKHESRHDLVHALYLSGCAYADIGLPWAARGTLLNAASLATDELWKYGDLNLAQAICFRRLKWVELQLGRIPHALAWHEIDLLARSQLAGRGHDAKKLFEGEAAFQLLLGRLLLRTDLSDLKGLASLPDVLDRLSLPIAADALLFALGYDERARQLASPADEKPAATVDLDTFMGNWFNAEVDTPMADHPQFYDSSTAILESRVLGCHVSVDSENEPPCTEVAESFLAAMESFVATSALKRALAYEPELTVRVRRSDLIKDPLAFDVEERDGRPFIEVRCQPFDPHSLSIDTQQTVRQAVLDVVIASLSRTVRFKNLKKDLLALFRDERVADRASNFTGSFGTLANVLGASSKATVTEWTQGQAPNHPLLRHEPWTPPVSRSSATSTSDAKAIAQPAGSGSAAASWDMSRHSHRDMAVVSLIRLPLWNKANWRGTAFMTTQPVSSVPPVMGLLFNNPEAGLQIFTYWRQELGEEDQNGRLRVVVVRGISRKRPYAYRVIIGSEPNSDSATATSKLITCVSKMCTMEPASSQNLERFLEARSAASAFYLAPARARNGSDGTEQPEFALHLRIKVRDVHVREAWEIGPQDLDCPAVYPEDDPVIPHGQENAPVKELLRKRARG